MLLLLGRNNNEGLKDMANKFTTGRSAGRKSKHTLKGGPLHGQIVELYTPGTLEFTCKGEKGKYDNNGCWVESK